MKLVCIGASYKFVRNAVQDLIKTGEFEDSEIAVVDIYREPLDIVVNACKAIAEDRKSGMKIWGTTDRREALKDADFVLIAITVGGFDAWMKEIDLCKEYGICHVVGDTIGPAALSKSIREIPVMLEIARDMEECCPGAWMINVSNPMTALVKAVSAHTKVKVVGLCHGAQEIKEQIALAYGVESSKVSFKGLGVNHLVFARDISVDGRDVTKTLYQDVQNSKYPGTGGWRLGREYQKLTGYLPLIDDKHFTEFLPYYLVSYFNDERQYGEGPIDFNKRLDQRKYLERVHREFAAGTRKLDADYAYSGENVHGIMLALYYGREGEHIVNIPNRSYSTELKANSVIEIPARVSRDRIEGINVPDGMFEPHIISTIYNLNVIYDYTVEAAVTGNRERIMQALYLDPMVRHLDIVDIIPKLTDDILEINRQYLPEYWFK